jgi:hypothetical protein
LRRTFNPSVSGLIESSFAEVNRGLRTLFSGASLHITVSRPAARVNVG